MMEIPQLTTCCGCFSLRSGSKIIGWLSLVFGLVFIAILVTMLLFFIHLENKPNTKEEDLGLIKGAIYMTILSLIVYAIQSISGFILLLGAYQAKAKLVYVWIFANIIAVMLNVISGLALAFLSTDGDTLLFLIGCAVDVYFVLVVYSYYREIQNSPVYSV